MRNPRSDTNDGLKKAHGRQKKTASSLLTLLGMAVGIGAKSPGLQFAGLARCGKSCRLRWLNYLRPDIKRGNYTQGEVDLIIQLHNQLGNRWSAIAAKLPGRTDNEITNHWHTNLKNKHQNQPQNDSVSNDKDEMISKPSDHHSQGITDSATSGESSGITTLESNQNVVVGRDHEFSFLDAYNEPASETQVFTPMSNILTFPTTATLNYCHPRRLKLKFLLQCPILHNFGLTIIFTTNILDSFMNLINRRSISMYGFAICLKYPYLVSVFFLRNGMHIF